MAAYRSVAMHSALILARILPLDLQADLFQKMYREKKKRIDEGRDLVMEAIHNRFLMEAIAQWRTQLQKLGLSGRRVREAIIPQLYSWITRKHGNLTFRMSQIITGHGVSLTFSIELASAPMKNLVSVTLLKTVHNTLLKSVRHGAMRETD